jgi:hypothetical protein
MIRPRGNPTPRPEVSPHSREQQLEINSGTKNILIALGVAAATLALVVPQLDTNNTAPVDKIDVINE